MDRSDFERWSRAASAWSARYVESVAERPVRAQVAPGDVLRELADAAPEVAEPMEAIFADFERLIPGAMTHWQHPRFFAYFPSNAAPAAIVAEQLAAAMAAQCMLWQTSPAATELETRTVDWLRRAVGLPEGFLGTFQDTASSATLAAILVMRERANGGRGNVQGLAGLPRARVYASTRTHSSIDKAMWIAGLGQENLVKIPTGDGPLFPMRVEALGEAIAADRAAAYLPAGIVVSVGGTSVGATDEVRAVCELARAEGLYTHVDAAWAGSAMICPEYRALWDGVELADSVVLNPHKWLGTGMECSAHFVRDAASLVGTLAIRPEYLRTHGRDGLVNYSEWSLTLGRRFRALKVWFLLRAYGLEGLRTMIRNHVRWAAGLHERLAAEPDIEIVTAPVLSLFSFRHVPGGVPDSVDGNAGGGTGGGTGDAALDAHNLALVTAINDDGRIYLTQTEHDGRVAIRFQAGQFDMSASDADVAFDTIVEIARSLPR